MSEKYTRYDFEYNNDEKKKYSKWLYIGGVFIIVILVKMLPNDENRMSGSINKTSFSLEIPRIDPDQHIVKEISNSKNESINNTKPEVHRKDEPTLANHDNEAIENYPHEWDWVKNGEQVCWFHKESRKKSCYFLEFSK